MGPLRRRILKVDPWRKREGRARTLGTVPTNGRDLFQRDDVGLSATIAQLKLQRDVRHHLSRSQIVETGFRFNRLLPSQPCEREIKTCPNQSQA